MDDIISIECHSRNAGIAVFPRRQPAVLSMRPRESKGAENTKSFRWQWAVPETNRRLTNNERPITTVKLIEKKSPDSVEPPAHRWRQRWRVAILRTWRLISTNICGYTFCGMTIKTVDCKSVFELIVLVAYPSQMIVAVEVHTVKIVNNGTCCYVAVILNYNWWRLTMWEYST